MIYLNDKIDIAPISRSVNQRGDKIMCNRTFKYIGKDIVGDIIERHEQVAEAKASINIPKINLNTTKIKLK